MPEAPASCPNSAGSYPQTSLDEHGYPQGATADDIKRTIIYNATEEAKAKPSPNAAAATATAAERETTTAKRRSKTAAAAATEKT